MRVPGGMRTWSERRGYVVTDASRENRCGGEKVAPGDRLEM